VSGTGLTEHEIKLFKGICNTTIRENKRTTNHDEDEVDRLDR